MDTNALFKCTYGLYLLTARENGRDNGCIINTAMHIANDPLRVSIAVIRQNLTCDMIRRTGIFTISAITTEADFALFRRFGMQSGRDTDKFAGFPHVTRMENGLYALTRAANMTLSARVTDTMDLGSHLLFIGEITDARVLSQADSCTYSYYQSAIKPKPQPAARTQWVCQVCGYVCEAGQLPDGFLCPICRHGREVFLQSLVSS